MRLAQDWFGHAVTPTMRAILRTREAWAFAKLGRASVFHRAADKARGEFDRADATCDPYWLNYFDAAELSGTIGGRLLELARNEAAFAGEAADAISKAINLRQPNRWRSSALDRLGVAEARLIQGEYDEARRLGVLAVDDVRNTGSDRVQKKMIEVYQCTYSCGTSRPVIELRDLLHPLIPSGIMV